MNLVRYHSPDSIVDFTTRYFRELNTAVANRMRTLGVPEAVIGIRDFPGVDETAFTRFPDTQIGGNINSTVFPGREQGIALDHGIFDTSHPIVNVAPTWRMSRLSDRADAAIAHEYIESTLTPPDDLSGPEAVDWIHHEAIHRGPFISLPISRRARTILSEYQAAAELR